MKDPRHFSQGMEMDEPVKVAPCKEQSPLLICVMWPCPSKEHSDYSSMWKGVHVALLGWSSTETVKSSALRINCFQGREEQGRNSGYGDWNTLINISLGPPLSFMCDLPNRTSMTSCHSSGKKPTLSYPPSPKQQLHYTSYLESYNPFHRAWDARVY